MPSSVSGRRKGNRAARANRISSTSINAPPSPVPLPAIAESTQSAPAVAARILSPQPGVAPKQKKSPSKHTAAGNEIAIVQNSVASNKPNVFDFLQEGDSSSTTSDSDSDHEDAQALADSQQRQDTRDVHSSYLVSPGSSFRASSPEQTFSVTSRDSTVTDIEPTTSPEASPATEYLRLVNKHNLQKIAQTQSQIDGTHRRQTPTTDDEQSDYSAPEDYYLTDHIRYPRYQHQHQHPLAPRNSEAKYRKAKAKSKRQPSPSSTSSSSSSQGDEEKHSAALVTTTQTQKENKLSKLEKETAESTLASGYALLASKLDSSLSQTPPANKLVPVYRRFENVNHRILLYLQDEISQMEEELRAMDEFETKHRAAIAEKDETEHLEPASRRMDVEAQQYSAFHARRLELVDRLAYKVNQYNDALCSYTKMRQILPKASPKDVQTYRSWMRENTPIAKNETLFLENELDLVSLNITPNTADDNHNSILYFIIGVMSAALLLPLLAY